MKLYEVNQLIEGIFEQLVDPETGEVVENEALLAQLDSLQMERSRILEYLCKLVLNTRSQMAALKEEEKRLKERRASLERKDIRLMEILDRECGGEKTDCGVATVCYRKTEYFIEAYILAERGNKVLVVAGCNKHKAGF